MPKKKTTRPPTRRATAGAARKAPSTTSATRPATRRSAARSLSAAAPAEGIDDPIAVGSPCYPSVQSVLDDILRRKDQGWAFTGYRVGPEASTVHLFFE
ncbi:MAG: hypothetical protein ACKVWV_14720 [Planctomycetota bacterium]